MRISPLPTVERSPAYLCTVIGRGLGAHEALAAMEAAEQTVEGVPAAGLASTLVAQAGDDLVEQLPLLKAVTAILGGAAHPDQLVADAALPARA